MPCNEVFYSECLVNSQRLTAFLYSPPDIPRGHVDFTPEVWDAFDLLQSWGIVDIFRKHHPGEAGQYVFFDYRVPRSVERGLGWRVDHILATAPLADQSIRCSIDLGPRRAEKPSDHTVMTAEFII